MTSALEEALAAESKGIKQGWVNILGSTPLMPREVTMPWKGKGRYQQIVRTTSDYLDVVARHADEGDVWVGMYPTTMYDSMTFTRAYWDVDSPDLEDALVRARKAEEKAMTDYAVMPATTFTGGKGFHLHMEHEPLEGYGRAYEEATSTLMHDTQAYLDPGPLKNRKSSPRIPYSMHGGSYGKHGRVLYCVPVDLTWDLKDILTAAAEVVVTPFRVPHSQELSSALRPHMEAANVRIHTTRARPMDKEFQQNLIQAAISFSETVGWRLVNKRGARDGRRRVLYALYVPALVNQLGGNIEEVMERCRSFVELSGGRWNLYKQFCIREAQQCVLESGHYKFPMGLKRWLADNPDLRPGTGRSAEIVK